MTWPRPAAACGAWSPDVLLVADLWLFADILLVAAVLMVTDVRVVADVRVVLRWAPLPFPLVVAFAGGPGSGPMRNPFGLLGRLAPRWVFAHSVVVVLGRVADRVALGPNEAGPGVQ